MARLSKKEQNQLYKFFFKHISAYCDRCGQHYKNTDLKIINNTSTTAIIQVTCHKCKSSHLVHLVKQLGLANRIPLRIDLQPEELAKFIARGRITTDNVIDFHKHLLVWTTLGQMQGSYPYLPAPQQTPKPRINK